MDPDTITAGRRKRRVPVATHRGNYRRFGQEPNAGAEYTPEEIEFMLAMDRRKRETRNPYPDCRDVLEVIRRLGYRKAE